MPFSLSLSPQVFCEGDLLDAVQTTGIFQDSKEFVDMPMRQDPEVILEVRIASTGRYTHAHCP